MQSTYLPNIVVNSVYKLPISGFIVAPNRFRAENNTVYICHIAPAEYTTVADVITNKISSVGPLTNQNIDNKDVNTAARFYSVVFVTGVNTSTPPANATQTFTWTVYNPEDKIDDFTGPGLQSSVNPSTIDDIGIPAMTPTTVGGLMLNFATDLNGWDGVFLSFWGDETVSQGYFFLNVEFCDLPSFINTRTLQLRYYAKKISLQLPKMLRYVRMLVYNGLGSAASWNVYGYGRRTQQDLSLKAIATGLTPYVNTVTIPASTAHVFYVPVMGAGMRLTFYSPSDVRLTLRETDTGSGSYNSDTIILSANRPLTYDLPVSAPTELRITTDSVASSRSLIVSAMQLHNPQGY